MNTTFSPVIGRVKGPGQIPHTFNVVAFATEKPTKIGEFVLCDVSVDGVSQTILARVIEHHPLRLFPDSFLANPGLAPKEISAAVGYAGNIDHQMEFVAEIIGYYDQGLEDFINPRIQPTTGTEVKLACDAQLTQLLSRLQPNQVGAAVVGSVLSRETDRVPIALDVAAIVNTHLSIISSTGAGKSYLAGVIIEEMLRPNNRAAIMVIDPHGEYATLSELTHHPQMIEEGYRPDIRIHQPGDLKIQVGSLSLADLRYLLPNLSERMEYVLGLAYRQVRARRGWSLADLRQAIQEIGQPPAKTENSAGTRGTQYRETANALIWRINAVFEDAVIFGDVPPIRLRDLVRPGRCAVLQLNEVDVLQQQVMVATLLRHIYRARIQTTKKLVTASSHLYLPYPVFVLIEEAHHFAPASGESASGGVLKQVLAEGRKFGVGVGLISQRPGKLDADTLSQCNTQCLLRIINPVDQMKVRESVETVGQELLRELPALSRGQAIIAGAAVNTPILCRVRKRFTTHSAENISAPHIWRDYPL